MGPIPSDLQGRSQWRTAKACTSRERHGGFVTRYGIVVPDATDSPRLRSSSTTWCLGSLKVGGPLALLASLIRAVSAERGLEEVQRHKKNAEVRRPPQASLGLRGPAVLVPPASSSHHRTSNAPYRRNCFHTRSYATSVSFG